MLRKKTLALLSVLLMVSFVVAACGAAPAPAAPAAAPAAKPTKFAPNAQNVAAAAPAPTKAPAPAFDATVRPATPEEVSAAHGLFSIGLETTADGQFKIMGPNGEIVFGNKGQNPSTITMAPDGKLYITMLTPHEAPTNADVPVDLDMFTVSPDGKVAAQSIAKGAINVFKFVVSPDLAGKLYVTPVALDARFYKISVEVNGSALKLPAEVAKVEFAGVVWLSPKVIAYATVDHSGPSPKLEGSAVPAAMAAEPVIWHVLELK